MEYPYFGKSDNSELVVLFTSYGLGEVIVGNNNHPVGEISDGWIMSCFSKIDYKEKGVKTMKKEAPKHYRVAL